jgi:hypothetical protein
VFGNNFENVWEMVAYALLDALVWLAGRAFWRWDGKYRQENIWII